MAPPRTTPHPSGFSLLEILVSIGIFAVLTGLILANYKRGSDDSVLSRETLLLMSRIRLAQEQSAGGTVTGFCNPGNFDVACTKESDCTNLLSGSSCVDTTPSGGFGVFASCSTGAGFNSKWPDRNQYLIFADRVQCQQACFPFDWDNPENLPSPGNSFAGVDTLSDHLFSSGFDGLQYRGDTIAETFTFDPKVTLVDLQLVEAGTTTGVDCVNKSAWAGLAEPAPYPGVAVHGEYPLQTTVHFAAPDGRSVVITDNVSTKTPNNDGLDGGKKWGEAHFMLGLVARPTQDCQVVRVTKDGIVTKYNDEDCQF